MKEPNDHDIAMSIANLSGYRTSMFPQQLAIDIAVRKVVDNYTQPLIGGVSLIKDILVNGLIFYQSWESYLLVIYRSAVLKSAAKTTWMPIQN